jgi:hypothetical protein
VLYLPRGHWHAAVGLGEPSLHLTIGLTRKTGADLLHWLADEALTQEPGRADLPFEAGDEAVAERLAPLLRRLAGGDMTELARRYRRHVEAMLPQRPALCFPLIGLAEVPLPAAAELALAPGPARLRRLEGDLVLSWRGVEFSLSPQMEAPVRRLVAGEVVCVHDFGRAAPAASEPRVQDFLGEMLRRGAFVVIGPEPAA